MTGKPRRASTPTEASNAKVRTSLISTHLPPPAFASAPSASSVMSDLHSLIATGMAWLPQTHYWLGLTMLTVLVLTLIILVPVRPSRENAISMPRSSEERLRPPPAGFLPMRCPSGARQTYCICVRRSDEATGSVLFAPRAPCAPCLAHARSRAGRRVPRRRARSGPAPNPGLFQSEYGRWSRTALVRASARGE